MPAAIPIEVSSKQQRQLQRIVWVKTSIQRDCLQGTQARKWRHGRPLGLESDCSTGPWAQHPGANGRWRETGLSKSSVQRFRCGSQHRSHRLKDASVMAKELSGTFPRQTKGRNHQAFAPRSVVAAVSKLIGFMRGNRRDEASRPDVPVEALAGCRAHRLRVGGRYCGE